MDLDQETEIPQAEGALQQNTYPPAVSNITQEINNHTPVWRVILLFLIFQPIALFIIFKEKYYHGWIAFLLWLHAIPLLIVYIIMKISVLPQLESLYKNLNLTNSFPIINLLLIVFIIFMLAQIIFGIFVFYKNRFTGCLSKGFLATTLVFFIIDLFISPAFIIISLLNPLYSLISSVEKQTTIETFQLSPTPTPDPTANWKTYANEKYGFLLKIPASWKYLELPNSAYKIEQEQLWFTSHEFPPAQTGARADITIIISTNDPLTKYSNYLNNYKSEHYDLGNVTATKISGINKEGLNSETAVIANISRYYLEILPNYGENSLKYFDKILSTFKLLNNAQADFNLTISKELKDFQVYPNSTFIEKKDPVLCQNHAELNGFSDCNATTYIWKTNDDFDSVFAFYKNREWFCAGAGSYVSPRSASGGGNTCRKGDIRFGTFIISNEKETNIEFLLYPN